MGSRGTRRLAGLVVLVVACTIIGGIWGLVDGSTKATAAHRQFPNVAAGTIIAIGPEQTYKLVGSAKTLDFRMATIRYFDAAGRHDIDRDVATYYRKGREVTLYYNDSGDMRIDAEPWTSPWYSTPAGASIGFLAGVILAAIIGSIWWRQGRRAVAAS